jgi:hypothetical protein
MLASSWEVPNSWEITKVFFAGIRMWIVSFEEKAKKRSLIGSPVGKTGKYGNPSSDYVIWILMVSIKTMDWHECLLLTN